MPREDDEKPKRPPGRQPYRTFHDRIGFHISSSMHQEVKRIAAERQVRLEEVYAETISQLFEIRERKSVLYISPPFQALAMRVTVPMDPNLSARVRDLAKQDHRPIADVFQTAVHLYLESLSRLPLQNHDR